MANAKGRESVSWSISILRAGPRVPAPSAGASVPTPAPSSTSPITTATASSSSITDQTDSDLAILEARHRAHARVEDRIRCAKDTGLENFPFRSFASNQVWLELVLATQDLLVFYQRLCLEGEARNWEPKKLRYRLLHTVGRMISSGRRRILRLQRNWPWTPVLLAAFRRLRIIPATT